MSDIFIHVETYALLQLLNSELMIFFSNISVILQGLCVHVSCPSVVCPRCYKCTSAPSHLGVGERGVAMLRVELQGDEGDLRGDPGHHHLHRLVLGDAHVLERSRQENHPVCDREGKVMMLLMI